MSLNTLNRYKYTRDAIAKAVKVLKTGSGASPSFLRAHPKAYQAKGKKLFQGGREVIPVEEKKQVLRKLLYENKNDLPFGRDSLFHVLIPWPHKTGHRVIFERAGSHCGTPLAAQDREARIFHKNKKGRGTPGRPRSFAPTGHACRLLARPPACR